jgi:D-glycero-alpha-D-manno-heptose-7-phosphate kinase
MLAEQACKIEIIRCREPIGKQDQYAAAYGGLRLYRFSKDGSVTSTSIQAQPAFLKTFRSSVLFFYTGISRSASSVLHDQKKNIESNKTLYVLEQMRDLALDFASALEASNMEKVISVLNQNWELKKQLASNVSTSEIDGWFEKGMEAGASCGKLLGAGSGGFLMFLAAPDKHEAIKSALSELKCVPVDFDNSGSKIIFNDEEKKDG